MFDFLKPVMEFFTFIVDMVKTLIESLASAVGMLTTLFGFLPPQIGAIFAAFLAICVLYKILGRESGG